MKNGKPLSDRKFTFFKHGSYSYGELLSACVTLFQPLARPLLENFSYNKYMKKQRGRAPKRKGQRKDFYLRIPMTRAQKDVVMEAALECGEDMASWCRPFLLEAAERILASRNGKENEQS